MNQPPTDIELAAEAIIETPPTTTKRKSRVAWLANVIRDIVASVVWLYAPTKLLIYDVDILLVDRFAPHWLWLLRYKFPILIGAVALIWLVTKSWRIFEWAIYIAFFPFIVFLWKVPRLIFKEKSWTIAIALANVTISFFRSAKFKFIVSALFTIAFLTILRTTEAAFLWLAIGVIFALMLITVIQRFANVLRPVNEFGAHISCFTYIRDHIVSSFRLDQSTRELSIEMLDAKQLAKWTSNLQMIVLFNRVCLFSAKKLREYHRSGIHIAYHVVSAMILIVLTSVAFAAINLGLYKGDHTLFTVTNTGSLYDFFYYSFNGLLFRSVLEITPVAPLSQFASMVESFFALFLVAIFASFFFAIKVQRSAEDLDLAIAKIAEDGKFMESLIVDEYQLSSVALAVEHLQRLESGMLKLIILISKNLE